MIEFILAITLILIMPARAMYKSLHTNKVETSRSSRYITSSAMIFGLLAVLAYSWIHAARSPEMLGLDVPVSMPGMIGLATAVSLSGFLCLMLAP